MALNKPDGSSYTPADLPELRDKVAVGKKLIRKAEAMVNLVTLSLDELRDDVADAELLILKLEETPRNVEDVCRGLLSDRPAA